MTSFESIGIIKLSGKECFTFLNNQTTSKIEPTETPQCHYSVICNPKGRVLFSFFVITEIDELCLAVNDELTDDLVKFLNMRRFRMQVEVELSESLSLTLLPGETGKNLYPLQLIENSEVSIKTNIWSKLFEWRLPWIEKEYQEKFIPQHLSLDIIGAIDFKKGCYPGQEIIARLHYLGEVKKRLQLIEVKQDDHNMPFNEVKSTFKWCSDSKLFNQKLYRQAVVTNTIKSP